MKKYTEYYKVFESENHEAIKEGLFSSLFGGDDKKRYGKIAVLCNKLYDAKMKEYEIKIENKEKMSSSEYRKKNKNGKYARKEEIMNSRLNSASNMVSNIQTQIDANMKDLGGDWREKAEAIINDTNLRIDRDIMQKAESELDDDDFEEFKKEYDEEEEEDEEFQNAVIEWQTKRNKRGNNYQLTRINKPTENDVTEIYDAKDKDKEMYINFIINSGAKVELGLDKKNAYKAKDKYDKERIGKIVKVKFSGFDDLAYFVITEKKKK